MVKTRKSIIIGSITIGISFLILVYFTLISTGVIQTHKNDLTIKTDDYTHIYNGDYFIPDSEGFKVVDGELYPGHRIRAVFTTEEKNVGIYENRGSIDVVDRDNKVVNDKYNFDIVFGTITIEAIPLTLKSLSASKEFDGNILKMEEVEIIKGALLGGDVIDYNVTASITEPGEIDNIFTTSIFDRDGIDVTANYNITYVFGTLEVTPTPIILQSESLVLEYDGNDHSASGVEIVSGQLKPGHEIRYNFSNSIRNVGSIENVFYARVYNQLGNDVTNEYRFDYNFGTLTITKRHITITSESLNKVYDGNYYISNGYSLSKNIVDGDFLNVEFTNDDILDVGNYTNTFNFNIITSNEEGHPVDGLDNYEILLNFGTVSITKKSVHFISSNMTKTYDGNLFNVFEYNGVYSNDNNLLSNHRFEVVERTNFNEVSRRINMFSVDIFENERKVTDNYKISYEYGEIEITKRDLSISSSNLIREYNDEYLEPNSNNYNVDNLPGGHVIRYSHIPKLKDVGTMINTFVARVFNSNNVDVSNYFNVYTEYGTLEVTPRYIDVNVDSLIKTYDGNYFKKNDFNISIYGLVSSHISSVGEFNNYKDVVDTELIYNIEIFNSQNVNVTTNYQINKNTAYIQINPLYINISSVDLEKVYDGKSFDLNKNDHISSDELPVGDTLNVSFINNIVNVFDSGLSNNFEYNITNNNEDVTNNYQINVTYGRLTILKRDITVKSNSETKVYDGESYSSDSLFLNMIKGSLVEGQKLNYYFNTNYFNYNVGTYYNDDYYLNIIDNEYFDYSDNYNIKYESGKLEITRRPITFTSIDKSEVYNGEKIENDFYSVSISQGSLVDNHYHFVDFNSNLVDVGTSRNTFTVTINSWDGDITYNYDIKYNYGELEVTKRPVTIQSENVSKTYDDESFDYADLYDKYNGYNLVEGHHIDAEVLNNFRDAKTMEHEFKAKIYDGFIDKTKNYEISYEFGSLTINPKSIYVYINSLEKEYDSYYFSLTDLNATSFELLSNHNIKVTNFNNSKDVISDELVYDVEIYNSNNKEVTNNYVLTKQYATINIYQFNLSINSTDLIKTYDGKSFDLNKYDHITLSRKLPENDILNVTFETNHITDVNHWFYGNNAFTFNIANNNEDVTSNYNVFKSYGTLIINSRVITIKSNDRSKVYDGLAFDSSLLSLSVSEGSLVFGQKLEYNFISLTNNVNVGVYDNNYQIGNIDIVDSEGNIKTYNYTIKDYEEGTLEITKRPITIQSENVSKTYDDESFDYADLYDKYNGYNLVEGHHIDAEVLNNFRDAGIKSHEFKAKIFDNFEDVTNNYNVSYEYGMLEITKKEVDVTLNVADKIYNGEVLNIIKDDFNVYTLVNGHDFDFNVLNNFKDAATNKILKYTIDIFKDDKLVSNNYNINYNVATATILKREIDLYNHKTSKVYDGKAFILTSEDFTITSGSLVNGDKLFVDHKDSFVIAADFDVSNIDFNVFNNGINVTNNYNINETMYSLKIDRREITVKSNDDSKVYDGFAFDNEDLLLSVIFGTLVEGHLIHPIFNHDQSNRNVDSYINEDVTYEIRDEKGHDVTNNYSTGDLVFGTLQITKRPITITSEDYDKTYDDKLFTNLELAGKYNDKFNSLVTGHVIKNTVLNNFKDVKTLTHEFVSVIEDSLGNDLTSNYKITYEFGLLEVKPRPVYVYVDDLSKTYNSKYFIVDDLNLSVTNKVDSHEAKVTSFNNSKDVINDNLVYDVEIYDSNNKKVTDNYILNKQEATISITPFVLNITSSNLVKTYDSKAFDLNKYDHITLSKQLPENDILNVAFNVSGITEVSDSGFSNNIFIYNITNNNEDVTDNYQITTSFGNLTINEREITLKTNDFTKVYDGEAFSSDDLFISVIKGELVDGHWIDDAFTPNQNNKNVGSYNNSNVYLTIRDEKGHDVSDNYNYGIPLYGDLEITKRPITIKSDDYDQEYDGELIKQFNLSYQDINNVLLPNHFILGTITNNFKDVKTSRHYFTVIIEDSVGNDYTDNYDISYEYGILEITPKEIVVELEVSPKVYDGKVFDITANDFTVDELLIDHNFKFNVIKNFKDAGTEALLYTIDIFDENNKLVSNNYDITYVSKLATIQKRPITITNSKTNKVYDGKAFILESGEFIVNFGNLVNNDKLSVVHNDEFINYKLGGYDIDNLYIDIINDGYSVLDNYNITTDFNKLNIDKRPLTIMTNTVEKVYDGNPFDDELLLFYPLYDGLIKDHVIDVTFENTTDVNINGFVLNSLDVDEIKYNGEDVTDNYNIDYEFGKLIVNKRYLYLYSDSGSKVYDNTELKVEQLLEDKMRGLVAGHSVYGTSYSSITNVGSKPNDFTAVVEDNNSKVVTDNYEIVKELGIITIKSSLYDTPQLFMMEETYPKQTNVMSVNDVDRNQTLYFRHQSYGDYEGTYYSEGIPYNKGTTNGMNYGALALSANSNNVSSLSLDIEREYVPYLKPYYLQSPLGHMDDVYTKGPKAAQYEIDYYNYRYSHNRHVYLPNDVIDNQELVYRNHVRGNYLYIHPVLKSIILSYVADEVALFNDIYKTADFIREYGVTLNNDDFDDLSEVIDIVRYFFEDVPGGHQAKKMNKQHFTAAGVMLYRALGRPARFTTGYKVKGNGNIQVTNEDAHTWVEVYIDGFGWVPVDMTEKDVIDLELRPKTASKKYDGDKFTYVSPVTEDDVIGFNEYKDLGYTLRAEVDTSPNTVGEGTSWFRAGTVKIYNPDGLDVTEEFDLTLLNGRFRIYDRVLEIKTNNVTKEYDGISQAYQSFSYDYRIVDGPSLPFPNTEAIELIEGTEVLEPGTHVYEVKVRVIDSDGVDVTARYFLDYIYGHITITKRNITIKADNFESNYTGSLIYMDSNTFINTDNKLLPGHYIEATSEASGTNRGIYESVIKTYRIYDEDGTDVTHLYNVTTEKGLFFIR